jgi:hypothetical protein
MTIINGFNGIFDPINWSVTGNGILSFNIPNTILTFTQNFSDLLTTVQTLSSLPTGTLSFDWSLSRTNYSGASYTANGTTTTLSPNGFGSDSGSVNIIITGNVLSFNININEDGTSILDISNFQFQYNNEVPCFNEGSKILCLKDNEEVYVPIEKIQKGYLVKTYKHGYKRVEIIGKKKIYNLRNEKKQNRIFKLSTDKFPDLFEDLYLTGLHSILVDNLTGFQGEMTINIIGKLLKTDDKYRLITCLDTKAEMIEKEKEYTIYHFALENDDEYMNYGIYANGLLVESSNLQYMKKFSGMESL